MTNICLHNVMYIALSLTDEECVTTCNKKAYNIVPALFLTCSRDQNMELQ